MKCKKSHLHLLLSSRKDTRWSLYFNPMKKMKKILCSLTFWLLLQLLLSGCNGREEDEEVPEVSCAISLSLDWKGVKEMPENIQVIFYSQETGNKLYASIQKAEGDIIKVKPGRYKVLIYNCDNGEYEVKVRNIEKLETVEAYSEPYTALAADKNLMWEPLPIYTVLQDIEINEDDKEKVLRVIPKLIIQRCSFEIKVEGLEYVKEVSGSISGVSHSYFLGLERCSSQSCNIFVEMQKGKNTLKGSFYFFGTPDTEARAATFLQQLTVRIVRRDNSVQEKQIDITEVIQKIVDKGNEGGGNEPGEDPGENPEPEEIIEIEENIEVPYVPPPSGGEGEGGGGIGGEVDDWGDEEEIVLPMK